MRRKPTCRRRNTEVLLFGGHRRKLLRLVHWTNPHLLKKKRHFLNMFNSKNISSSTVILQFHFLLPEPQMSPPLPLFSSSFSSSWFLLHLQRGLWHSSHLQTTAMKITEYFLLNTLDRKLLWKNKSKPQLLQRITNYKINPLLHAIKYSGHHIWKVV